MSSKSEKTCSAILEACWKLLESGDHQNVHMSHIAKTAGVSRQAVYLHFQTRAELLIATTRYIDKVKKVDELHEPSRSATRGIDRLEKFIGAWADYIPEIYGVAKALRAMKDKDDAANDAWNDRMCALRHGCEAVIKALKKDGVLSDEFTVRKGTDALWTLLSISNWEQLTQECKWSQNHYKNHIMGSAKMMLLKKGVADN